MYTLSQRAQPYQLPGYPDYLAALLHARGINTAEAAEAFLNPSACQLHDPFLMHGMEKAVSLIREAIRKGRIIAVYGDYDADGVCASAILMESFRTLKAVCFSYIPDRQEEGYGINAAAVREISGRAGLLISVDCGITAVDEVRLAKELGLTVIITDHHALQGELPPADALVHPALGDYPFPELCGAGVAFKLACALLGDEMGLMHLDLAALATIADLVPLTGENRVIAALGLKALGDTSRPGLVALMEAAGVKRGQGVRAQQVGYQLAPRLNAGGRLATAEEALRLLITRDGEEAAAIAQSLDALNRTRRQVELEVLSQAEAQVRAMDLSALRSLVAAGEGWNSGVVGLAAGKLAERYGYPAIVLSRQGEELVGSGRSAGSIDLFSALTACAPHLKRFGGHKMAAGLALNAEHLPAFTRCFDEAVREQLKGGDLIPDTVYDYPLTLSRVTVENAALLSRLAPFGIGNPAPVFLLEDVPLLSARGVGTGGAHLKLSLGNSGAAKDAIAFGKGHLVNRLPGAATLVGSIEENSYMGCVSAQVNIRDIFPGREAYAFDEAEEQRAMLRALSRLSDEKQAHDSEILDALPEAPDTRGTLFVAWCHQTAEALHRRYPGMRTWVGAVNDPRAFSAILYLPDWQGSFARFTRVVMADGLIHPLEAAMIVDALGDCRVQALPRSQQLSEALLALSITKDTLREAYIRLRQRRPLAPDLPEQSALQVLYDLDLITLNKAGGFAGMREVRRCEPDESALFRNLQL
ncbi:MAG: single-stranded-DNA-specific exonuclease RecJ [Christensenellales bacterium]|jgi:single-stranded-DNA-specific exonuclease